MDGCFSAFDGLGDLTPFSAICIGTGMVPIKSFCSL